MLVNFGNLGNMVENGQRAYEGGNFGSPIVDSMGVSMMDHQFGDYANAADLDSVNNPNDFIMGFSKWGSPNDTVTR